ncbi:MAG: hypothetical protein KKA84_07350 [Bacteroidetes bacterium]|nr:hypothetical protein [Bacteroidota bacterium]
MENKLVNRALVLSIITIVYNIGEGLISVYFGMQDETLALFGFGADSFVEVFSGIGILHMVIRMKYTKVTDRDSFEKTALRITGIAFYLLTFGLIAGSVINIISQVEPETTMVGVIVSAISILTMYFLMKSKLAVGKALKSDAIIADANCTRTCFYLSFLLLGSSLLYELTGIGYIDIVATLGIAYFAFKEGREAFDKVRTGSLACSCDTHCNTPTQNQES